MKNTFKVMSAIFLMSGLGACVNNGCNDYQAYRNAKASSPITVPADLDQPVNESTAPEVTVADPNTLNKDASGACLDQPPKI